MRSGKAIRIEAFPDRMKEAALKAAGLRE
jgi:hypothetical protein